MSDLDTELQRLMDLDEAVKCYLSHLWEAEQGAAVPDGQAIQYWLDRIGELAA